MAGCIKLEKMGGRKRSVLGQLSFHKRLIIVFVLCEYI
jgi:hypothetical protein